MLKVGVMSSHANHVNGRWGIDTVKQFLYSLLINNEATRGVSLEVHIDVPMQLLFLGVTKTVAKRVMEWTKAHNLMKTFLIVSSCVLDAVGSCNIDWCVALKLTEPNFGGWVSENFLALARLGKWFYSLLTTLNKDEDYVEPSRPCTTWSIKELNGWLKNLGLPDKGQKCELLERVQHERERLHMPN